MAEDCLFCKIASGETPSDKVYADGEVFAFRDISPAAPTHILVIPVRHLTGVADASDEDRALLGKMLLAANRIAEEQGLAEKGFRYVINTGEDGGQSVFHLHLHVLGGRKMAWPPG